MTKWWIIAFLVITGTVAFSQELTIKESPHSLAITGDTCPDGLPLRKGGNCDGASESMDIPAVKVQAESRDCLMTLGVCTMYHDVLYRYSCADKSRVLLTSEDGKKHCIKVPQGIAQKEKP